MTAPDRLIELTAPAVRDATRAYLRTRDAQAFERAMQEALAKAHTAAYVRGLGEQSAGGKVREWLSKLIGDRALPKAEREAIAAKLKSEFGYLHAFVQAAPDLSDAQIAQRAALYVGAARATYWQAWAGVELDCTPGGCPACYGRCRCSLDRTADGIYWRGPADAHSCSACRDRVGRRMDQQKA